MISKNDIGIFSIARLSSKRLKKKMIRKFSNSTLTDIVLSKLSKLGKNAFFAGHENIFKKKALNIKLGLFKEASYLLLQIIHTRKCTLF